MTSEQKNSVIKKIFEEEPYKLLRSMGYTTTQRVLPGNIVTGTEPHMKTTYVYCQVSFDNYKWGINAQEQFFVDQINSENTQVIRLEIILNSDYTISEIKKVITYDS